MADEYPFQTEITFLDCRIHWHASHALLIDILREQFLYEQNRNTGSQRDRFDFYVKIAADTPADVSWNTTLQHRYDPDRNCLLLSYLNGAIRVRVDYQRREVWAEIMERALIYRAALSNWVLTIPLSELLKAHGFYLMHAACLVKGDRGVLFAGRSGAGKTTLSLGLLTMGWQLVSDDEVFLQKHNNTEIMAWGGPERAKITWQSWRRYAYYLGEQPRFNGKRIINLADVFPGKIRQKQRVDLICFIQPGNRILLSPMMSLETYQHLLSVAFLTSEPAITRRNSDFLYQLSRTLTAYRLETNLDIKALAAGLQRILKTP